ncbi:MAG: ATP citrate lyase citrate-binding domain-containing protein [Candidatus Andersenbacteria bacterium]
MNLLEHEGKALLAKYGISIPKGKLITPRTKGSPIATPAVIKSQVPVGDRGRKGGITVIHKKAEFAQAASRIWDTAIDGHIPQHLLVEEAITSTSERYISLSYDTTTRAPTLAINAKGGSGTAKASLIQLNIFIGLPDFLAREALVAAGLTPSFPLISTLQNLWQLFVSEKAILAEINPLFELKDGSFVAGDAKVVLDDHVVAPEARPYVQLGGDIAILASGGGASMINLDALMKAGGKPANYVEYSGNPKSDVVRILTRQVLSQPNLKGCWVVGGTANFTDIYETLLGFVEGLRSVKPRPTYPIVIRRDGPRQREAFAMLEKVAKEEGFNFHLYGPETPMSESATTIVKLAYQQK